MGVDRGVKSIANVTMMDDVLLLLSGASGAGKSSVREGIAATLAPEVTAVELRDLDTIPQTPTLEWRQRMAECAVLRAHELDGHGRWRVTRSHPERWLRRGRRPPSTSRSACSTRRDRLRIGGWQAMRWSRLTDMAADRGRISVIDGSNLTKTEANQAVLQWVIDTIEGRAPGFKRPWKP